MRPRFAVLAALSAFSLSSFATVASAHVVMTSPPARDVGKPGADAHKAGPCGVARTGTYTQYAVGAQVPVQYTETIDHRGCFQVLLSEANDANFRILAQVNDPDNAAGEIPRRISTMVTLPAGVSCQACTISVRQLMINRACVNNEPSTNTGAVMAGDTYYTCSDICIGTNCPPQSDAGAPVDASVPPSDAGHEHEHDAAPSPTPTSSTPTPTPTSTSAGPSSTIEPADDSGCATSPIGVAGSSSLALFGLGATIVALGRRRRRS